MSKKKLIAIMGGVFIWTCTSWAATLHRIADGDTYIDDLYPNNNFGQQWKILTSGSAGKPANGLLHFDFSSLPQEAIVTKATLTLCVHGNHSTTTLSVHPLITAWQEDLATWYTAQSGIDWETPGGDFDPALFTVTGMPESFPGWIVMDVIELITDDAGRLKSSIAESGLFIQPDDGYNKILSAEFTAYGSAQTCHSCHRLWSTDLDIGKSTSCAQCHFSGDFSLRGEPALILEYQPMRMQFVQISDSHIGRSPQQALNLKAVVTQINEIDPSFVLFTGDLTDHGAEEEYILLKSLLLDLTMPYYCVPGDNDIVDYEAQGGDLQRYHDQLGDDYYAFYFQGLNIIGINNCFDLALDEDQLIWLEQELQKGGPEIIFGHRAFLDYQNGQPFSRAGTVLSLFDSADVLMYVNGNDHVHAEHTVNDIHHVWCDNLSYAHDGDPYNLYRLYTDRVILYHIDLRDESQNLANILPLGEPPTLVTMSFFQATVSNRTVEIEWQTENEIDNAGFNLYRAEPGGEYKRINPDLIPARGSATEGAQYHFRDEALQNRITYRYRLEDIDNQGQSAFHGPVSATPRLIPARKEHR